MATSKQDVVAKATEDDEFRELLKADPHAAIEQLAGADLGRDVTIEVLEDSSDKIYIVLPPAPESELSSDELEAVAGGGISGLIYDSQTNHALVW